MKKIMLLIFIALSLIGCRVNAIEPDELELDRLPVFENPTGNGLNPSTPSIDVYRPTFTGTITGALQSGVHRVEGYQTGLPSFNGVTTSHILYAASAVEGAQVFSDATRTIATHNVSIAANGSINISAGAGNRIGGRYKIWVISVVRP